MTYNPRAHTDDEKVAKDWMYAIKSDRARLDDGRRSTTAKYLINYMANAIDEFGLRDLLSADAMVVPVPGSGLHRPGTLWVPYRICDAMIEIGVCETMCDCLERTSPVAKSAFSKGPDRPKALDHYNSMRVNQEGIIGPKNIVLVDDIITRGATFIGAGSRMAEAFPNANLVCFGLMRTMGYVGPFVSLVDPAIGRVTLDPFGDSSRLP